MALPLIAAGIGAAANIAGSYFSSQSQKENMAAQMAMQKEFAQKGIQWKVADAQKAGIHPLYALGAQTHSFSPMSVGDTSVGSGLAAAGQDISRAINATRTQGERDKAFSDTVGQLNITKLGLENELLAAQIAKIRANINPPMPDLSSVPEATKFDPRPKFLQGGVPWITHHGTTNVEDTWAKRYGEPGEWVGAIPTMYEDLKANYGQPAGWPNMIMSEAGRRLLADILTEYQNARRFFGRR